MYSSPYAGTGPSSSRGCPVQKFNLRRIVVDCRVIEENLKLIARHLGEHTRPIWVVKSHAYGFGLDCIQHVSSPIAGYGVEDFVAAGEVLACEKSKPVYILYPISPTYCPARLLARVWDGSIIPTVAGKNQIDQWVHSATKAGVIGITRTAAKELAPKGINVNCIAPGFIWTDMLKSTPSAILERIQKNLPSIIPLNRFGSPRDIADLALFLASDESSYITGQVIYCDGGMGM